MIDYTTWRVQPSPEEGLDEILVDSRHINILMPCNLPGLGSRRFERVLTDMIPTGCRH